MKAATIFKIANFAFAAFLAVYTNIFVSFPFLLLSTYDVLEVVNKYLPEIILRFVNREYVSNLGWVLYGLIICRIFIIQMSQ